MRKIIALLSAGLILTGSTAFASPIVEFEKGSISLEAGSALNSKVKGTGHVNADVNGNSGFKAGLTAGLSKNLALQYKHGLFKSEKTTLLGITTYAQAELNDINLLYKVNPNLTLISGYEHTTISYGLAVSESSKSTLHLGLSASQKLNEKTTLFATLVGGKNTSLKELGISYKFSPDTAFNVSYAERKVKNMDMKVPARNINGKENYNMTGITCMFDFKL